MRALVSRLPTVLSASVAIGPRADTSSFPLALRQLLKLATTSNVVIVRHVELDAPRAHLELASHDRSHRVEAPQLAEELGRVLRGALEALYSASELVGAAEAFASQAARLEALHELTSLMLRSSDLDRALFVMLSGITSGHGLAMNRAALFLRDDARRSYVGAVAIGPSDAAEAHRIWEAIEVEGKTMEHLVEDYATKNVDGRFHEHVRTLELRAGDASDDEILIAEAADGPVRFTRDEPRNASLAALRVAGEWVVSVVKLHGTTLGLVVCDNVYSEVPVGDDELEALERFLSQSALVWQNLSLLSRVESLARHDALTGLLNRRAIEARLEEECSRAARNERPISVLVLDLDHFKSINDDRGHAAGDEALRAIGGLLTASLRANDFAGRIGGDEFLVLLPEATEDEAVAVARRIGEAGTRAGLSLSIGGATWPGSAIDVASLVSRADESLYGAKRDGRSRALFASGVSIGPFDLG